MKHTFAKLMAMLMVLVLTLTGCNLIDVDQAALIEEQKAELMKGMSAVMAEYDGGTITAFDVMASFYSQYSQMAQMYSAFGMNMDQSAVDSLVEDAVRFELETRLLAAEYDKRGLTMERTEEEIMAEAEEAYQQSFDYYLDMVDGATDEEKAANAELALFSEGFTRDVLKNYYLSSYKAEATMAAIEAEVEDISEEDLKAAYDEKVAMDEEVYTQSPTLIEDNATDPSMVVCWQPEGYRTVKHVLVIPEDEVLQAVTDARNALETAETELEALMSELDTVNDDEPSGDLEVRTVGEIEADIEAKNTEIPALKAAVADAEAACLESVKAKTDEVYAALEAGEDFDAVMAEYGEDPGMKNEPAMSTGYYVSADSTTWDSNFTAGAMALSAVGDYSSVPVVTSSGVHIVYYNSDVPAGPVPFENVRDRLYEDALSDAKTEHFETTVDGLTEAVNPVYHFDAYQF